MECREFRREAGADPRHLGAAAAAHCDTCPACAEFLRETLALDDRILIALQVPVPADGRPSRVLRFPPIERRRWIALAASIVAGVLVGSLLWLSGPRATLAEDLVKHVVHEPNAMIATSTAASPAEVTAVLEHAGVRLAASAGVVSYARTCPFRGEKVPHLVVQTASGPVTVMVLRHEKVAAPVQFDEGGYAGTIVPDGPGSIAVIGHAPAVDLSDVAEKVRQALTWN